MKDLYERMVERRHRDFDNAFLQYGRGMISKDKLHVHSPIDGLGHTDILFINSSFREWATVNEYGLVSQSGILLLTEKGRQHILMELI